MSLIRYLADYLQPVVFAHSPSGSVLISGTADHSFVHQPVTRVDLDDRTRGVVLLTEAPRSTILLVETPRASVTLKEQPLY